jgi:hypothetical protein
MVSEELDTTSAMPDAIFYECMPVMHGGKDIFSSFTVYNMTVRE